MIFPEESKKVTDLSHDNITFWLCPNSNGFWANFTQNVITPTTVVMQECDSVAGRYNYSIGYVTFCNSFVPFVSFVAKKDLFKKCNDTITSGKLTKV